MSFTGERNFLPKAKPSSPLYLTVKCCTSLQLRPALACNVRAMMPAARGALAEVPVCDEVLKVIVCDVTGCEHSKIRINYKQVENFDC